MALPFPTITLSCAPWASRETGQFRSLRWQLSARKLNTGLTAMTFVFYVIRTEGYGGKTSGARWFFWLVPLWLLTMLPEADRWALDRRKRRLAGVLLALSVATASFALANPWQPSWLLTLFRHLGIVAY